ncbi:hypothetical protein BS78_01G038100 [Paspalum vaginatum]|nr:hypothetical protein BS78_01G038100 [Paspalum vaginatum]
MNTLSPRGIHPQTNDRDTELSPSRRKRCLRRGQSQSYGVVVRQSALQSTAEAAAGNRGMRMENQYDGNDDWAYNLVANIDKQLPSQRLIDTSTPPVVEAEEQTPTQRRNKQPKGKNVSRRGGGFTKEEDAILCSAFLNVSKDAITGVNQSSGGYYKRMHEFFEAHKPEGSNRSQLAIQGRWGTIQKAVNRFCGFKAAVDRRNESGKNEQDRIDEAVELFEEKEPFSFKHCWIILRDEPKWNDRVLELNNTPPHVHGQQKGSPTQGEAGNGGNVDPERPDGRDKAKKMRTKRMCDTSESSTAVEVLQMMTSN